MHPKYFEFGYLFTLKLTTMKMKFNPSIHVQCNEGAEILFPAYVRAFNRTQKTPADLFS
jgi:hypothetical protein